MISAEEARMKRNDINSTINKQQLEKIEEGINKNINKGYTYYYGKLTDTVEAELIKLGYRVEFHLDQRDGDFTTIKW